MHDMKPFLLGSLALLAATLTGPALSAQTAPAPQPDPAGFTPGPGVETVQARCAACHPATMVTAKRYTAAQWAGVVDQMMAKGAQVGDDEYDVIVTYLAKTYGVAP